MTRDEFIKRYHNYSTQSKAAAMTEAMLVNAEGIIDGDAVVVRVGDLGYCLMLQDALAYLLQQDVLEYLSGLKPKNENGEQHLTV